ncbi:hypothetical protein GW933_00410 [Candidatus Falkowbacteria bacterium]|uniref:Uncharacterized protein n=1 Tax=Candidatus Buchananbacteria bacterium CG10_big_fil_rev_8_21_14_0_10_33_19 TaxID=1974525 RepID=A0A2H0W555_9BACT|nr:hypothetical protein [Candidatus Falkowbacteria bacterium]PIS05721.1 MAG: hypothetical protein COT80_03035 [Candidatus Buchananbacteria bacterium CG10_big_fil_rev_8_21_14_0_10_33_19]
MESIQKVINLIKKTGDKVVILDKSGDLDCVIMNISDYEKLVFGKTEVKGLTEDELLDKINRDIEIWKDSQENGHLPIDQHDFSQELDKNSEPLIDYNFNEMPPVASNQDFSLNLDNSEEEDEDRYYFEPVE